jgi:hypothetical protein
MLNNLDLINKKMTQLDHEDHFTFNRSQPIADNPEYYNIQQQPTLHELADELNMEAFIGDEALVKRINMLNNMKHQTTK